MRGAAAVEPGGGPSAATGAPPKGPTYQFSPVEVDFATVRARDVAAKPEVMQRQRTLLAAATT